MLNFLQGHLSDSSDFPTPVWLDAALVSSLDFKKERALYGIVKSELLVILIPSDTPKCDWTEGLSIQPCPELLWTHAQNDPRDCLGWSPVRNWPLPQRPGKIMEDLRRHKQIKEKTTSPKASFPTCELYFFGKTGDNIECWLAIICPRSCYVWPCSVEPSEAAPSKSRHRCQLREGKHEWGKWSWTIKHHQTLS